LGLINNLRKNRGDKKKQVAKKVATKAILATIIAILKKVLIGMLLILAIGGFFTYLIGRITSEETPKTIYKELEIEDIKELVLIKGNSVDRIPPRI